MERYSPTHYGGMEPDPDGSWVRFDEVSEPEPEVFTPDPEA